MLAMNSAEISVIIPTLNEEQALPHTLERLGRQERVSLEVIVVDGGSTDATERVARTSSRVARVITTPPGRSRQLNAGAVGATGDYLLFLHADSWFPDPLALRKGVDQLRRGTEGDGTPLIGGHFSLTFARSTPAASRMYAYYECKARLNRPGCSHGDQGFLLPRRLFTQVGPFCEQCELLAQTRFADLLRSGGQWQLLEAEIISSARRFETEGLLGRQILNGVIMICGAVGRDDLLTRIPGIYRQQRESSPLPWRSFLCEVGEMVGALPEAEKRIFWQRAGGYLVDNAWQGALMLDVLAGYRSGRGAGATTRVRLYDRHLHRLIDNYPGRKCAELALRGCLYLARLSLLSRSCARNGTHGPS